MASDLSRVVVIGTSGSGKTTFARDLAVVLSCDHVEMDRLYWLTNWVERDTETFVSLVAERASGTAWTIDGNHTKAREVLWPRATALVWLNYAFPVVFWRSLQRTVSRSVTGQEICNGNRETLQKAFLSRDSILVWVLTTYRKNRQRYRLLFDGDTYPHLARIELTSTREAKAFLQTVMRR